MSNSQGDTTTDFVADVVPAGKYLVNPYEDWAEGEGVPIVTGRAVDLMSVETRAWPRFDCKGALVHVEGRCDFLTVFLYEIAPGKAAAPQRHVYDELAVVLAGTGETEIEMTDGEMRAVRWRPGTLLGAPTNARYRHRNTGSTPARLACFNDLRYLMGLYRSERFIFDNQLALPAPSKLSLSRDLITSPDPNRNRSPSPSWGGDRGGGHPSETHLKDSPTPSPSPQGGGELRDGRQGGGGPHTASSLIVLGSGTIGADLIELPGVRSGAVSGVRPGGSDTKARRQMQGAHLLGLGGEGITRSWREGQEVMTLETKWRHGVVVGLPGMHFHRHASTSDAPARAFDIQLGSALFPLSRSRRHHYGDTSVYASGSAEMP